MADAVFVFVGVGTAMLRSLLIWGRTPVKVGRLIASM